MQPGCRVALPLAPRALPGIVLRRLLPALLVAAGALAAARRLVPSAAVETGFGATLVAMGALFVFRLGARVRSALGRPEPHASPIL